MEVKVSSAMSILVINLAQKQNHRDVQKNQVKKAFKMEVKVSSAMSILVINLAQKQNHRDVQKNQVKKAFKKYLS